MQPELKKFSNLWAKKEDAREEAERIAKINAIAHTSRENKAFVEAQLAALPTIPVSMPRPAKIQKIEDVEKLVASDKDFETLADCAMRDYEKTLKHKKGLKHANRDLAEFCTEFEKSVWERSHYDDEECVSAAKIKANGAAKLIESSVSKAPKGYEKIAAIMAAGQAILDANVSPPSAKNEDGFVNRVKCVSWWRKVLRKQSSQRRDQDVRVTGSVKAKGQIYCADATVYRRRGQIKKNNDLLSAITMENEKGYQASLLEMAGKSVANPEIRRLELMTRIRGAEEFAKKIGYVGEFWTITAPSRMHRFRGDGRKNRNWDKSTPRQVNNHVNKVWARVRAKLARDGVTYFGIRVVEPHHDGCPHWHLLLFMPASDKEIARKVLARYALEDSPEEQGAQKNRVKCIAIDNERGSAAGYVAKYVSKSINGAAMDADEFGNDAKDAAERIAAWASCWRIRQFQFFGSPPVSVWREFRRFNEKLNDIDDALENLREACDEGKFDKYFELQVMHCAKLIKQNVEELNRYGEQKPPEVIGIACENEGSEAFVDVIRHEWKVVLIDVARMRGAWSSVNNCTGVKNGRKTKTASAPNRTKNNRVEAGANVSTADPERKSGNHHH